MNPFPDWARWIWAGIFVVSVLEHLAHVVRMSGVHRLWHLGHTLMAIGMAYMFVPPQYRDTTRWPWQLLFAAAAILAAGYALARARRGTRIDLPWIALTIGLAGMWYMWAMRDGVAWAPFTYVSAVWFLAEAVGWFTGELCGRNESGWLPTAIGPLGAARTSPTPAPYLAGSRPVACRMTRAGRLTLGLMAVGMAYMLAGMQLEL
ncbi:MAG: DUF5134 domain-containing protein [Vicinamibacterales bacterium]